MRCKHWLIGRLAHFLILEGYFFFGGVAGAVGGGDDDFVAGGRDVGGSGNVFPFSIF